MRKVFRLPFDFSLAVGALLLLGAGHVSGVSGFPEAEGARKVYRLTQALPQSEIDAVFLRTIDTIPPPFPASGPYQIGDIPTVPGRFTVYKFVAEYPGESAQGRHEFHDLLVIQTAASGEIEEACHYTLEWTDVPSLDLFRFQGKGIVLKNGLKTRDLNLVNVQTGAALDEEGLIVIKD